MKWNKDLAAWVAMAALLGGGLIGWGKITAQVEAHEPRIGNLEKKMDDILQALGRVEGALGTKPGAEK